MADSREAKRFLSGVVEGFYGRPWTTEQRLILFHRMSQWGLTSYLYAPKDDDKHRANWRDLYLLDEVNQLSLLIQEASKCGIDFIYAIAPGLDITFSSEREVSSLKRKLDQLVSLGCYSFAILFDDIECDMCLADTEKFPSFAHSQVALSNDIYEHLGKPKTFLFCPTEYCGSRAQPSVTESQYLKHIGEALHPDIDIMWTGPRVISKAISVGSIMELTAVLKRPPVIWDNLHANDYDCRRLFLGPYLGRPSSLIPLINGVFTNPNCEYSLNHIAIYTLSQWVRSRPSDARQESSTPMDLGTSVPHVAVEVGNVSEVLYEPVDVLNVALQDWFVDFHTPVRKVTTSNFFSSKLPNVFGHSGDSDSLVSSEGLDLDRPVQQESAKTVGSFSLNDLRLLVDFYYLPFQHGPKAVAILDKFNWLKEHAPGHEALKLYKEHHGGTLEVAGDKTAMTNVEKCSKKEKVQQWLECAKTFHDLCQAVDEMYVHLTSIPNRPLLYDLYHYVWDAKEATSLLKSYTSWLENGGSEVDPDHEPCVHQGGIVADMQRLLPQMNSSEELFNQSMAPESPPTQIYTIRPYCANDRALVYQTCLETGDSGDDATQLYPNYPDLLGDRYVGPYCTLSSDLAFMVEDSNGVCGYVLGVLDSQHFYEQVKQKWVLSLLQKYPATSDLCKAMNRTEQAAFTEMMNPHFFLPEDLQKSHPSHLHIDLMKRAQGKGIGGRLINTVLSALKAKGSHGVHLEMSSKNKKALRFYLKLGFTVLNFNKDAIPRPPADVVILGRQL